MGWGRESVSYFINLTKPKPCTTGAGAGAGAGFGLAGVGFGGGFTGLNPPLVSDVKDDVMIFKMLKGYQHRRE